MKNKTLCRPGFLRYMCTIALFIAVQLSQAVSMEKNVLISAQLRDFETIEVKLQKTLSSAQAKKIRVVPDHDVRAVSTVDHRLELKIAPLDLSNNYQVKYKNDLIDVRVDQFLNEFVSDKELGCTWDNKRTTFRLFAPRAKSVQLFLFENVSQGNVDPYDLVRDTDGVWELTLDGHYFGKYYAYSVDGPRGPQENFNPAILVADPYSRAVATGNDYRHQGKTLILDTSRYDWQGDTALELKHEDLIIYECHVRDLTAHPSAGAHPESAGSYKALIQKGIRGGIEHIKSLGVNAVEFLPIHDFGNIEIPYGVPVGDQTNTWNPYARNHWGYMTSCFFAPESYYASDQGLEPGQYCGADGHQVNEFKDVVKAFHDEGIAVILDVVYNHVSEYDQNSFKFIDKKYYFHLNNDGTFCSASGCGNDFKTDRPMARRLIIESVKFWLQEYHIDGFRFDLAAMIDWETIDEIAREAKKINPDVILIAEPWGGGDYAPAEFSQHGWAAWNDHIRNGVKGQNPYDNHGFIFGKWFDFNSPESMKKYVIGYPEEDGGLFQTKAHAINYLESHDDHTLGDFIRIGLGGSELVTDVEKNAQLSTTQLRLNKLGALFLFTCQGAIMIHEGQEWARSKVIAATDVPDEHIGYIDHNSYNKDNETNWLNFEHADLNAELVEYYKGLIKLRTAYPAFRHADKSAFEFFEDEENAFALAFKIDQLGSGDQHDFFVALNGSREKDAEFSLPPSEWDVIVDGESAGTLMMRRVSRTIKIPPSTGTVLRQ
ncbi:pullulanase [candidate division KSB1 bacterium]|nr:pullulanase [candidate division KSB1 bacterium]